MWLNCSIIDLDYNQIYSIKWFKDNDEMYRFITSSPEELPTTFYDTPGIVIDESRSNYGNLYVSRSEFKTEADFRCEVLAENDFNTAIQIKRIKPIIVGRKSFFGPNESVNLTCTSPMSTPAARLVVNLNGNSLIGTNSSQKNRHQPKGRNNLDEQEISMRTYHQYFENGQSSTSINVRFSGKRLQSKKINQFECTSSIIHRFNRSTIASFESKLDPKSNQTTFQMIDFNRG
ncbi:beat protein-like protein 1 [Sarcoptes scabiei]|uniref:Beat protein-like protein 1 n=1 Tax=Sarcoptes scabiei TaxID=52283 RepID=A0A132A422_SARSC|nr:beat protein-like protein 1 [Sarcoptes scabiei]